MKFLLLAGLVLVNSVAHSQSINIDLDGPGGVLTGGGVPDESFGGAANQPGQWNSVYVADLGPTSLVDINGNALDVVYSVKTPGYGNGGGGSSFPGNTGDYAKLLNDSTDVFHSWIRFSFSGLTNGHYRVLTYAVNRWGNRTNGSVSVASAIGSETQPVTGPMVGNSFEIGITHSMHTVLVTNNIIEVMVNRGATSGPYPTVNGFQIQSVPEPASIFALSIGAAGFFFKRKRRSLTQP